MAEQNSILSYLQRLISNQVANGVISTHSLCLLALQIPLPKSEAMPMQARVCFLTLKRPNRPLLHRLQAHQRKRLLQLMPCLARMLSWTQSRSFLLTSTSLRNRDTIQWIFSIRRAELNSAQPLPFEHILNNMTQTETIDLSWYSTTRTRRRFPIPFLIWTSSWRSPIKGKINQGDFKYWISKCTVFPGSPTIWRNKPRSSCQPIMTLLWRRCLEILACIPESSRTWNLKHFHSRYLASGMDFSIRNTEWGRPSPNWEAVVDLGWDFFSMSEILIILHTWKVSGVVYFWEIDSHKHAWPCSKSLSKFADNSYAGVTQCTTGLHLSSPDRQKSAKSS